MNTTLANSPMAEMIEAVNNGLAKPLTVEAAKRLRGKYLRTIYFGYKGQNGCKDILVGDIISQFEEAKRDTMEGYESRAAYWGKIMRPETLKEAKDTLVLLALDGQHTYFHAHNSGIFNNPTFTCSDIDRQVFYIVL